MTIMAMHKHDDDADDNDDGNRVGGARGGEEKVMVIDEAHRTRKKGWDGDGDD